MIRILVVVLIAANLLYFGWSQWVDRDQQQLTAVATPSAVAAKPAPAAPVAAAAPAPPPPCATLGPFGSDMEAGAAEKQLTAAGWGVMHRDASMQQPDGYWVYVKNDDVFAQGRTLEALRRAGVLDAFAMPDDTQYRVSVGIFSDEARARDRASRVQKLKLDAVVTARTREQPAIWLDIPGVARETLADGRLKSTGLQLEKLRIEDCPAAPADNTAAAPATADAASAQSATAGPAAQK